MGLHWGEIGHCRGIISYGLSPYEQKPFVGFISKGFPNLMRRFAEKFFIIAFRNKMLLQ